MPGTGVDRARVPATVQTISEEEMDRLQPRNLTDLVEQTLRAVSVTDVQNSPYQQNLSYRGFTLSPLLGEAQGIAVYMNGVRVNEGFGDTMQWDLVPEAAIQRIDLVGGNPAYGLNALGGALALQTHTGLTFSGSEFEVKGGSHGRLDTAVQAGGQMDALGVYVAAERGAEDGWRDRSDSEILRFFGDATYLFDEGSLSFGGLVARTEITGNGTTPEDLLGVRRESVFTYPDITDNDLNMFTLGGDYELASDLRVSGLVYHRSLQRNTVNGDEFDGEFDEDRYLRAGEGEDDDDDEGGDDLAEDDDDEEEGEQTVLFGSPNAGQPMAIRADDDDITPGAHNLTFTDTDTMGLSLQADWTPGAHQVVVGMAYDQSDTTFSGHTLVGAIQADRGVPPLDIGGQTYIVTHACELDGFDAATGSCEEDELEESEVAPLDVVSDTRAWGLYVADTFGMSATTDVTVSGRFNHVAVDLSIFDYDDGSWESESHTFRRFNPAVGLTHRLSGDLAVYGGYREGNRAPTAAELGCADPEEPCRLPNAFVADPPLDQVVVRSVEAGLRGQGSSMLGVFAWDLSTYASINDDDIIFVAVPETGSQPGLGYFQNYGETRRVGIDGQIGGRFNRWDWTANYSYVKATFGADGELPGANHPEGRELEGDEEAKIIDVESGDTIPGIPEHSLKFGVGYTLDNGLRVGTNWNARTGVYLRGDESNQLAQTDSYSVVNLTIDWTSGPLTLFGRVENLLDQDYETFGILGECEFEEEGEPCEGEVVILGHGLEDDVHHTSRFLSPGAPRSIFVGLRYRF